MAQNTTQYNPKVFDVSNVEEAKKIILTKESGMDTDERWDKETKFLAQDINSYFKDLNENSIVIDFGCGIGRISKEIIAQKNCQVIGVDISESMRNMAVEYVGSEKFQAISPYELRQKILDGLRVDAAISIWVLQHSNDPIIDTALFKSALKTDALVYILNNKISAVPTNNGWKNNGINIFNLLKFHFNIVEVSQLPEEVAKDKLHSATFIAKIINNKPKSINSEIQQLLKQAVEFFSKKEYDNAIKIYQIIIQKTPVYSDPYNGLAVSLKAKGEDLQKVINIYLRAVKLDPLNDVIYNNLSNAFKANNQIDSAIAAMYDAIRVNRKNWAHYNGIGMLFEKNRDYKKALEAYSSALKLNPNNTKVTNNIGVLLYNLKQYDKSVEMFKKTLELDPKYTEIYSNMGAALNKAKRYDEAIEALELAIKYHPNHGGAYTNLGNVYNKIHEYKKAAQMHEKSIKLEPNGFNAYSNVGTSYKNLGMAQKAINSYKKAIELNPEFENAHFDLATVYLANKNFKDGFKEYEWRFKKEEMRNHILKHQDIFSKERFDGTQNIEGKTLLLHTEQGFGDSIMFGKFVDEVKTKYKCNVILQCRDELKSLFENSFKNVDHFYARDTEKLPAFDYHYPMLSLPYLFEVNSIKDFPKNDPFLFPKKENDLDIEKEDGTINVGICWSASVTGESYDGKVFDVEYFRPLIEHKKFNVYSLQVGPEKEDLKKAGLDDKVIDLTNKLTDFNKSAYLMNQLDIVISSDTSVAHLAGAIGKEVWVPLQKFPDWRWENKGDSSYWYKSAKLFRQKSARVWDGVFQSIYDKMNKTYKVRLKLK